MGVRVGLAAGVCVMIGGWMHGPSESVLEGDGLLGQIHPPGNLLRRVLEGGEKL